MNVVLVLIGFFVVCPNLLETDGVADALNYENHSIPDALVPENKRPIVEVRRGFTKEDIMPFVLSEYKRCCR